jgi:2-polyprenyl-3-methyl-5-hydroxy-6-metoxy-1,4-benzoquinol methylase
MGWMQDANQPEVNQPDAPKHWNSVYQSRTDAELSWTQADPALSLALIREVCPSGRVIDVGGGTSPLAGRLLELGYSVAVLDISEAAIDSARKRLGDRAAQVAWVVADVTAMPALGEYDVWHDRAVFHFLIDPADRAAYAALLKRTIPAGGHAVIATFALDGPEKCSGLPVRRYDGPSLQAELGPDFRLMKSVPGMHVTPWGKPQSFQYSVFERI